MVLLLAPYLRRLVLLFGFQQRRVQLQWQWQRRKLRKHTMSGRNHVRHGQLWRRLLLLRRRLLQFILWGIMHCVLRWHLLEQLRSNVVLELWIGLHIELRRDKLHEHHLLRGLLPLCLVMLFLLARHVLLGRLYSVLLLVQPGHVLGLRRFELQ